MFEISDNLAITVEFGTTEGVDFYLICCNKLLHTVKEHFSYKWGTYFYTPPHSLKDSNVSSKVKTMEGGGVGVCSLARNTSGVEGHVGASRWGLRQVTSESIIHTDLHKPNKLFDAWLEHFWCIDKPWTHKIHHCPNLGKAIAFPLIVFFVISHEDYIQMSFFHGTPNLGVPKSPNWDFGHFGRL